MGENPTPDLRRPGNVVELVRSPAATPAGLIDAIDRDITDQDFAMFEEHIAEMFTKFGMNLDTAGTRDTPRRFVRAMFDATRGFEGDPKLNTSFPAEGRHATDNAPGQIIEGPIEFSALCEHHALPFHGTVHIGYVADSRIIGISKLTRIVRLFARRFTVQERLGEQIADMLVDLVAPLGVGVRVEATHMCSHLRGVEEPSWTVTTVWRGAYRDAATRSEFLSDIRMRRG